MAASPGDWRLLQTLGDRSMSEVVDGDVVSAVEFDHTGDYLATGDRAGRVRVFAKSEVPAVAAESGARTTPGSVMRSALFGRSSSGDKAGAGNKTVEYRQWHEYQSHEAEFDYLKSLEIEEKINCLRWCKPINSAFLMLTTNDKTIKLWKLQERKRPVAIVESYTNKSSGGLKVPMFRKEVSVGSSSRRVYSNGHAYHINSISLNSDCETFISADDLRINLWNLGVSNTSFNVVDIKPDNMEELTEVITAAVCHPTQCNTFLWSNSRGSIKLADMRSKALCDEHSKVFEEEDDPSRRSFFSEIISSIADIKFSRDGRYILSRDYMCLKLWDVNMESRPLRTIYVHEQLRSKLCDLYENDSIFDKFQCAFSGDNQRIMTGSYHNFFHVYDRNGRQDRCIEATKSAKKKPARPMPKLRGKGSPSKEETEMDLDKKVLHCSWHPNLPVVAVGVLNTVYVYADDATPGS
eukprot:CAMPEP_0173384490 /NCGR_PEP_ID=MMETSP1356-20130122/7059_1 /TAXON_ID=77927 ORGANISM="Hemiselmis virescens, Strain PCC157" /NCGR_SAMPLE_ID=MMETSP1356 /ASSEMBLY_ACC=CAM_ASM_000847 /LENGTH=464 /DNA_ID=CAMNT_0014339867 /DNA_START=34 /DNA_END=1428 /DNA_ORIENTATION=+